MISVNKSDSLLLEALKSQFRKGLLIGFVVGVCVGGIVVYMISTL